MAAWPRAANWRISSKHSQGFFCCLRRSARWALVSFIGAAGCALIHHPCKFLVSKSKRPIAGSGDGPCFLNYDCKSGNSFSGQRQAGRLATTNTHALAHQLHWKKVHAVREWCQEGYLVCGVPKWHPVSEHGSEMWRWTRRIHFFLPPSSSICDGLSPFYFDTVTPDQAFPLRLLAQRVFAFSAHEWGCVGDERANCFCLQQRKLGIDGEKTCKSF